TIGRTPTHSSQRVLSFHSSPLARNKSEAITQGSLGMFRQSFDTPLYKYSYLESEYLCRTE
ncbi:hypothetical protein V1478_002678, partial [Vespula squamosa]